MKSRKLIFGASLLASVSLSSCAQDDNESTRTLSNQVTKDSAAKSKFELGQRDSIVEQDFTFTVGGDGSCNQNCLSLVVNGTDTYNLGCNQPKAGCEFHRLGAPTKTFKLKVRENSDNLFTLRMTSANRPLKNPNVVFDSSDKHMVANVNYHINASTPSSVDLWINDSDDSDYHDFHGILTGPAKIRFAVDSITPPLYPLYADRTIDDCKNSGTGSEVCQWRYYYNDDCRQGKCSKLVIYFAGGEMTCPDPLDKSKPNNFLSRYAAAGYVAVCARLFETQPTAGLYPNSKDAARVDLLVKAITSDPAIRQGWNGERLLFSGVSHGSTSAVIAMARDDKDLTDPNWRGSKTTGACFFDGIYDGVDNLKRAFDNQCQIYRRGFTRYCPWKNNSKNTPDTCRSPDLFLDTIVDVDVSKFAIKNWKLIECGSALDYCTKDMVGAEPQSQLCDRINSDKSKSCTYGSFPWVSHNNCGALPLTQDECRSWFDQLQ